MAFLCFFWNWQDHVDEIEAARQEAGSKNYLLKDHIDNISKAVNSAKAYLNKNPVDRPKTKNREEYLDAVLELTVAPLNVMRERDSHKKKSYSQLCRLFGELNILSQAIKSKLPLPK